MFVMMLLLPHVIFLGRWADSILVHHQVDQLGLHFGSSWWWQLVRSVEALGR